MGTRLAIGAGCIVALMLAAACEGETNRPAELGDCTPSDPTFPCQQALSAGGGDDGGSGDGSTGNKFLDPTPCLAGGNILYFNGANGPVTVNMGTDMRVPPVQNWEIDLQIFPTVIDGGTPDGGLPPPSYDMEFSSVRPNTPPLTVGNYPQAQGTPYPGYAGMSLIGYSVVCMTTYQTEAFNISELAMDSADGGYLLHTFTVSFYETCNSSVTVYGCLHYGM
jgi:hypothetical protein